MGGYHYNITDHIPLMVSANHLGLHYMLINRAVRGLERRKIMPVHEKLDYVEYPAKDLASTKSFFTSAFGWTFVDYGPEYIAFSGQGLDGGFFQSDLASSTRNGGALVVFYSENLEETLSKVTTSGGQIVKPIFSFPGGRRFHFTEPSGNEFAVWSV